MHITILPEREVPARLAVSDPEYRVPPRPPRPLSTHQRKWMDALDDRRAARRSIVHERDGAPRRRGGESFSMPDFSSSSSSSHTSNSSDSFSSSAFGDGESGGGGASGGWSND